ncbi:MAG: hypothetical protein WC966_09775 [Bradymonadales bacterium]
MMKTKDELSLELLNELGVLKGLRKEQLAAFTEKLQIECYSAGSSIEVNEKFCILLNGEVAVYRGDMQISHLIVGDAFGAWGLWTLMKERVSLRAQTDCCIGFFDNSELETLFVENPDAMLQIFKNTSRSSDSRIEEMSQALLAAYSAPSQHIKTSITLRIGDEERQVRVGTPLSQVLPSTVDGEDVLAGMINYKPVSLNRPIYTSGTLSPLTRDGLEGRAIYRQSLDLLSLEAAYRIDPKIKLRIGPSLGFAHLFEVEDFAGYSLSELAKRLNDEMRQMVDEDVVFRRDYWSIEEARSLFLQQGWDDAVKFLRKSRNSSIALVSCGKIYAIEISPMVASARLLQKFEVVDYGSDLLLYFGDSETKNEALVRSIHPGRLAKQHDLWLQGMGITSVGAYNDLCISGDVSQIIRVSEGFHEKRISQIADMIVQRERRVKVICISGPSSSGKTTFLKRLSIQLQVNGLNPKCISLDNYYVDREKTVRDETGDYDFEAFEALNIDLLRQQLHDLVSGKEIRIARYDFNTGKSIPEGGPSMKLGTTDVLLLEGIHALNPSLPVDQNDGVFRIFINPMTSLSLDRVNRIGVSDLRLMRRIVRDRHQRSITATDNIMRWPSVRRGEIKHIFPYQELADAIFNTSLVYEISVLKVYAERYLLEVPEDHPAHSVAFRLRRLIDKIVSIYPDHVPQTSLLREFIGGSCFND